MQWPGGPPARISARITRENIRGGRDLGDPIVRALRRDFPLLTGAVVFLVGEGDDMRLEVEARDGNVRHLFWCSAAGAVKWLSDWRSGKPVGPQRFRFDLRRGEG